MANKAFIEGLKVVSKKSSNQETINCGKIRAYVLIFKNYIEFGPILTHFDFATFNIAVQAAIENEVAEFIENHKTKTNDKGHRLIVKNGYLPSRDIQSGIGNIKPKFFLFYHFINYF